jgi:cell shape-determining protein MreC
MELVLLLVYFQFSGILTSFLLFYIRNRVDGRQGILKTRKLIFEKRGDVTWLINYFQHHPKKVFKQTFPEIFKVAKAIKQYKKINLLQTEGLVTEKEYEKELAKILPLIDISEDLKLIDIAI